MSAGMRKLTGSGVGNYSPDTAGQASDDGAVVEVVGDDNSPVIEIVEPVHVDTAALGIDLMDPAQSPIGVPVALRRFADGVVRADADAIASRPTRDEVDEKFAAHLNDPTPHPVYDDLPDLTLLFENKLV